MERPRNREAVSNTCDSISYTHEFSATFDFSFTSSRYVSQRAKAEGEGLLVHFFRENSYMQLKKTAFGFLSWEDDSR